MTEFRGQKNGILSFLYLSSVIRHLPARQSPVGEGGHLSSKICLLFSVICLLFSVIRLLSSVFCLLTSVICYLAYIKPPKGFFQAAFRSSMAVLTMV